MDNHVASPFLQLRADPDGRQPAAPLGSEASGRPGLAVRVSDHTSPSGSMAAPPLAAPEFSLSPAQWGMIAFLLSEAALFSTLIVVYLTFLGKDVVGPYPREALSLPLVIGTTICLLSSSATIHRAEGRLRAGDFLGFRTFWTATIALGVLFLAGTGYEWHELITRHKLTLSRNLFGSTFYTLVGFHGL